MKKYKLEFDYTVFGTLSVEVEAEDWYEANRIGTKMEHGERGVLERKIIDQISTFSGVDDIVFIDLEEVSNE